MYSDRKLLVQFCYIALLSWIVWQIAFLKGYQDAENDFAKRGYDFSETRRAFK